MGHSHSVISVGGMTVEVKGKRVFINGKEVTEDKIRDAAMARVYSMVFLIVGFIAGAFSMAVILPLLKI
ncbi:hypothetical protein AB0539_004492 [Vibrio parahaemolyticus]|uniref:hypothetical protein n=1 Tax=Vibrio parahaemolyticus TaxID=670 RepID=UPI001D168920|nr:hypothetical protein [Vibrio parahaemolyticus]MCC3836253.1 hypothetical protein [Vibrio parahaemolyticus]